MQRNGNGKSKRYGWHLSVSFSRGRRHRRGKLPDFTDEVPFEAFNRNHAVREGHRKLKEVIQEQNLAFQCDRRFTAEATIISDDGRHRFILLPKFGNSSLLMTQRPSLVFVWQSQLRKEGGGYGDN